MQFLHWDRQVSDALCFWMRYTIFIGCTFWIFQVPYKKNTQKNQQQIEPIDAACFPENHPNSTYTKTSLMATVFWLESSTYLHHDCFISTLLILDVFNLFHFFHYHHHNHQHDHHHYDHSWAQVSGFYKITGHCSSTYHFQQCFTLRTRVMWIHKFPIAHVLTHNQTIDNLFFGQYTCGWLHWCLHILQSFD